MKIIQQTPTRLEIRHRPILQWCISVAIAVLSVYAIIQLDAPHWWAVLWFLIFLGSLYTFFVWHKIIYCLADQTTQTLYIRKHNLIQAKTKQKHFFNEVSDLEVREKRNKNGKYYLAFLNLKTGERIYIGHSNQKQNIENNLLPLAKFMDCYYNFVPRQGFFDLF